jgi:hypothetical protein
LQLKLTHNIFNGNKVAAACRVIACIFTKAMPIMSTESTLVIYNIYKSGILFVLDEINRYRHLYNSHIVASLAVCYWGFPDEMKVFINALATGENLKAGEPTLTLRNYLLNNRLVGGTGSYVTGACFLAAMRFLLKEPLRQIKHTSAGADFFIDKQKSNATKIKELCLMFVEKK